LEEGIEWIKATYSVQIKKSALSDWLRHRRMQSVVSGQLEHYRENSAKATLIGNVIGTALHVDDVNLRMIQQAIFDELNLPKESRSEDRLTAYMDLAIKARAQELKNRNLDLEVEKFKVSLRTKLEAGLEALAGEIQGNDHAMAKYRELKEELAKAA
jgi:hypothetical protein